MPPASVRSESQIGVEEHNKLTDNDFHVLHDIVTTAQKKPDANRLPQKALFAAYDEVIKEIGLDPGEDGVYFNYVLQIGDVPGSASLLDKFKSFFRGLGVELEFDDDQLQVSPARQTKPRENLPLSPFSPTQGRRRASFDSTYNGPKVTAAVKPRASSIAPILLKTRKGDIGVSRPAVKSFPESPPPGQKSEQQSQDPLKKQTRLTSATDTSTDSEDELSSSQQRLRQWQRSVFRAEYNPFEEDSTPALLPAAFGQRQIHKSQQVKPHDTFEVTQALSYEPTNSQNDQEAMLFRGHQLVKFLSRMFRKMCDLAIPSQAHIRRLIPVAEQYDRLALARQGLDIWYSKLTARRQIRYTEHFYARLERRAEKARDLYLLSKAFTHWAQCAHDEVQRTSTARRHILRIKYFKAWRDITVVNEFKVRRNVCKKFLMRWRTRLEQAPLDSGKALRVYQSNLVRDRFREWFWTLCEKRAPEWRKQQLKAKFMTKLKSIFQEHQEREGWVEGLSKRRVLHKAFRPWLVKFDALVNTESTSKEFRTRALLWNRLLSWNVQSQLAPRYEVVCRSVDSRLLRSVFEVWLHKARLCLFANDTDRLRVVHKFFSKWNKGLRIQTIAARINERVQIQALYKLVLEERRLLLQRLRERRLKQHALTSLIQRWQVCRSETSQRQEEATVCHHTDLIRRAWERWRLQMDLINSRSALADAFYAPRPLTMTLEKWATASEHLTGLKKGADYARYFFLVKKSIKLWRDAVVASQKEKRREAFARVRRRWKVHVRAEVLALWRRRTADVLALREQANHQNQVRRTVLATSAIEVWHSKLATLRSMDRDCAIFRQEDFPRQCLRSLIRHARAYREMEERASQQYQTHMVNLAARCFRALGRLGFEYKIRAGIANNFGRRHERRTLRNILNHWREKTQTLQGSATLNETVSSRAETIQKYGIRGVKSDATRRVEEWNDFDELSELGVMFPTTQQGSEVLPTPRPGYLNTPSKRAAHAKALFKLSTTTPVNTPPPRRFLTFGQRSSMPTPRSRLPLAPSALGRSLLVDPSVTDSGTFRPATSSRRGNS